MNDIWSIIATIEDFLKNRKGQKASWRDVKKHLNDKIGGIDSYWEEEIKEKIKFSNNIILRGEGDDAELQLRDEESGRMAQNTNDFRRVKTGKVLPIMPDKH